jgi:hypothetical protein
VTPEDTRLQEKFPVFGMRFSFSGIGERQSIEKISVSPKFLDLYQSQAWPVICILDGVLKQIRVGESGLENVVTKKGGLGNHEIEFI